MVVGAGWNGARAFTTTAGPGVSLMNEFIGLAYFAEIPVTILNGQRGGPAAGIPPRPPQSHVLACAARKTVCAGKSVTGGRDRGGHPTITNKHKQRSHI